MDFHPCQVIIESKQASPPSRGQDPGPCGSSTWYTGGLEGAAGRLYDCVSLFLGVNQGYLGRAVEPGNSKSKAHLKVEGYREMQWEGLECRGGLRMARGDPP